MNSKTELADLVEPLMAQREDLEVESGAGPHNAAEHRKEGNQHGRHRDSFPSFVVNVLMVCTP